MLKITLNLLPPQKKDVLHQGFVLAYIQTMALILFLVTLLVSGILIPVRMMMNSDYKTLAQQTAPESDEFAESIAEIRDINTFLKRVETLQAGFIPWSSVLRGVTDLAPSGIHLSSLEVATDNRITLSGTADTRDDLLAFEQRLKAAPFLTDVHSPLSNILQRRDVKFDIQMAYKTVEEKK